MKHRGEERWKELIERQWQSGLTIVGFCKSVGVPQWRKKLGLQKYVQTQFDNVETSDIASPADFVPVSIVDDRPAESSPANNCQSQRRPLEIDIPGGATVRVPLDHDAIRSVLTVLFELDGRE